MSYFLPINAPGAVQAFTQGAEPAGWYQLDTPSRTLDNIGIVPPPEATGLLLQANTDLNYSFSPAEAVSSNDALSLPANATVFIPGQDAMAKLSILLAASGGAFTIQFYTGTIGPVPTPS